MPDNGSDVDDYDPEEIAVVQTFDLALTKVVAEPGPFRIGDVVTYSITVYNQGTLDATDVVVTETPPTGMTNVDPAWTNNTFEIASIPTGQSVEITVDLLIEPGAGPRSFVNNAEITEATNALGLEDEDGAISDIDGGTPGDESELDTDDDIADDSTGTEDNADDSDDYDPAVIEIFDLALTKVLDPDPQYPSPGVDVTFTITVYLSLIHI